MAGSDPAWSPQDLQLVDGARELEITTERPDGTLRAWVPIWVVRVGGAGYVRTWRRRATGWYGRALAAGRARIRVAGFEAAVEVADLSADPGLRAAVDSAYRAKYGRGDGSVGGMVTDAAAETTLRLTLAT